MGKSGLNKQNNWMGYFMVLLVTAVLLKGCTNTYDLGRDLLPIYIGLAYDISGSVAEIGLQEMTPDYLTQLLSILSDHGGTMAFGLIDDKAFEPLLRLELSPVDGRLDERAQQNRKNQEAVISFQSMMIEKIQKPRNAQHTDINGAVARFRLFFEEPTIPSNAEKIALFITDGIDTGPWRKLEIKMPSTVKVYTVGIESQMAKKLFGERVIRFESIDAAIKYIKQNSKTELGS
jgi:hypothetical protein